MVEWIADPEGLRQYRSDLRLWQGVPGIEVTRGGRIYLCFCSGGVKTQPGNYVALCRSDDGVTYSEPIAVARCEGGRCYDASLWIDPLGRLWFCFTKTPDAALFAALCKDPDAPEPIFEPPREIGHNVMLNKPIVSRDGAWLFPVSPGNGYRGDTPVRQIAEQDDGPFLYRTTDGGESFVPLAPVKVERRSFDEPVAVEEEDGTLTMYVRTIDGVASAYSQDGGMHWSRATAVSYGDVDSRFQVRRLRSGRLLLINHAVGAGRSDLTAMLSVDGGETFPYRLLLDGRRQVSYPDVTEAPDGFLYIAYDRERGSFRSCMKEVFDSARELLVARITEADIIAGRPIARGSYLARTASKLTRYSGTDSPFSGDAEDRDCARRMLLQNRAEGAVAAVFDAYPINCANIRQLDAVLLDRLIHRFEAKSADRLETLTQIVAMVRSASVADGQSDATTVSRICNYVEEHFAEPISVEEIAERFGMSVCYICHVFKQRTGDSIIQYRNRLRISHAKLLLAGCDDKIIQIALQCGFENQSYFTRVFTRSVGMSPARYRQENR